MKAEEIAKKQPRYVLQSWSRQKGLNPIPVVRGEGLYFWDAAGRRYSDMSSQLVNLNLGHGNREIVEAIKKQADEYCYISPSYGSGSRTVLAEKLLGLMPPSTGKIFFTNAGADANENAVKMARLYTGRSKVFSRYRSYHGSTFGAGNLTGEPRRYALEPGIPGFVKFFDPYVYREKVGFASETEAAGYYVAKLREQVVYENPESVAAIVLETVTGSNGVIIPPDGYLQGVRRICDDYGIMLVCDEVMTGFGRTGRMFAFEHWGVEPDLISFAKGVTCGYVPLGGVGVSRKIADFFDDHVLSCGLTYSGHPLACAAGVAALDYYHDHDVVKNVQERGRTLGGLLERIKDGHPCVGDVRYIGLFSAVELVTSRETREPLVPYGKDPEGKMKAIIGKLASKGFMTYSHENMILVAPPLIITDGQLEEEMKKLDEVLSEIDAEIKA